MKWQAFAGAVQLAHAGHRRKNSQPPVMLAAVAHGIVMRSCQQGFGMGHAAFVNTDHVADCINVNVVKAAGAQGAGEKLGAGAVRIGQVSDSQLTFFFVARVAVFSQCFAPVPHVIAQSGLYAKLVIDTQLHHPVNIAQALRHFKVRVIGQAALKGADDVLLAEARTAWATNRQDERKPKFGKIRGVELGEGCQFFGGALREPGFALLVC